MNHKKSNNNNENQGNQTANVEINSSLYDNDTKYMRQRSDIRRNLEKDK